MSHFHAVINIPGYLPQSDDNSSFDTAEEAWQYLGTELGFWWDQEEAGDQDYRFLPAHADIHNHTHGPGTVHLAGPSDTHLGWNFSVTSCAEAH